MQAHTAIDVHHHIVPPAYAQALAPLKEQLRVTPQVFEWTPSKAIEQLDASGVAKAITSISTPGLWFGSDGAARRLARECNEYAAQLVSDHPGRFGMFVNLPMPDVEGSLLEIEYGFDVAKADGVVMFTNYGDKWLGDPAFDPVFEELHRRKALVYTHPKSCTACAGLVPGIHDSVIEYGADTTRAIGRMIFSGSTKRYRNVRLIWSHGGGTMPYLVNRFCNFAGSPAYRDLLPEGFLPEARRFAYDTAQVAARPSLLALKEVAGVDNILFGSDFPWGDAAHERRSLRAANVFSDGEILRIERENALGLLNARESA